MTNLRLITFNIAHGRGLSLYQGFHSARYIEQNLRKITKVLNDAEADFVAMQEVDEDSYWNKNINLLDVIRRETEYHHSYIGINNTRSGPQNLSYGNAILSRHPISTRHNQPFAQTRIGGKGFLYAEIAIGSAIVPIVNIHLDFRSRMRRVEQIEQVITFIESQSGVNGNGRFQPIVCGDFNCPARREGDAVHRLFDYLERDKHYTLLPEKARTFPAYFPTRTIDFVFMPHRYRIRHARVLPVYVSDHRPVLVEFEPEPRTCVTP
ncbi:MAG: endonuclease/exonuclease/phosphatase family protein [Pseudomonadales bacterium]|nr:endonuclease/exonuclease/phosphatase family protein [Pseudomonadales bacterium]